MITIRITDQSGLDLTTEAGDFLIEDAYGVDPASVPAAHIDSAGSAPTLIAEQGTQVAVPVTSALGAVAVSGVSGPIVVAGGSAYGSQFASQVGL